MKPSTQTERANMKVGADIQNVCTKCGTVAHVIVAIADGKIIKVECKECGSQHRNRSATAKKKAPARRRSATPEPVGPAVEPDLSRPVRPYQISDTYAVGDRIDHRHFGMGVIERLMGPSKVQVFFPEGQKTLLQGRST
jgi:hypothetical protein